MRFISQNVGTEWFRLEPTAQQIARESDAYLRNSGDELLVTCIYRSPEENDLLYGGTGTHLYGPHVMWHALDARSKDIPSTVRDDLVGFINSRWQYDPRRPLMSVMLYETGAETGATAAHFHIQVLPSVTVPRISLDDTMPQA